MAPRQIATAVALVLTLALAGCSAPRAAAGPSEPDAGHSAPMAAAAIAVIGDSMSLGVNACAEIGPCPSVSWALGDDATVNSVATRLEAAEQSPREHVWAATDGGKAAGAVSQVEKVVGSGAGLVMVLIGANDACAPSIDEVTAPDDFAASYRELLTGISGGLPNATILALSVPDLLQLWSVARDDPRAVALWDKSPSCRSLLADADSDAAAALDRRAQVDATVDEYNAIIGQTCADTAGCIWDGGALHAESFTEAQISTIDYFHAAASGQARISEVAWSALEPALPLGG